ncbi:ESX-3 secretion system protein EccA3 [Mycobacterium talmoniae]|uniref:ESX-3 secretion system protein EccA3 n=1 Tax=Mycobacterium talmoniae TaxID=1858794 RepID=A0A2S8BF86_9MYCO|nr:ESX-3 secretion system protein EccA3 [Mycobacterium talmoniae]
MSGAIEAFEAGLLALGYSVRGDHETPDQRMARKVLAAATRADPTLADGWLGRLAAGDRALGVYEGLWRCAERIGATLGRYGLHAENLNVVYESGMLITAPLRSADAAGAAYIAALCRAGRFDDAAAVFTDSLGADNPLITFAAAALYYQTQRWPQVVDTARVLRDYGADVVISAAARALTGHAQACLGLHKAAIATATDPLPNGKTITEILPASTAAVSYFVGAAHRALGQETEATEALRTALVADPGHGAARAMLTDPQVHLVTIDQAVIDSRSDPWDPDTAADPAELAREQQVGNRDELLAAADAELARQIGLADVKRQVEKLKASVRINNARTAKGLPPAMRSHHLVFTGPPGTGKTTIARVIAQLYCGLGVLPQAKVLEVKRADFVAGFLGQTAAKTDALIDAALDGVLFIDEAYTLIQTGLSGGDAFGREAVDTLLARMENDRHRLMVIIAGYDDEINRFLAANEGLASRFPKRINFPSYDAAELVDIAAAFAAETESTLDPEASAVLLKACTYLAAHHSDGAGAGGGARRRLIDVAGNARFIRNVIEDAMEELALRLGTGADVDDLDAPAMTTITAADMRAALNTVIATAVKGNVTWD